MVLIPTATSAKASSISFTDSLTVFQKAVADAISTAMGLGNRTCTVSTSGKAVLDVQKTINLLQNILGYIVVNGTSTLTITW